MESKELSVELKDLAAAKTYEIKVAAVNGADQGPFSPVIKERLIVVNFCWIEDSLQTNNITHWRALCLYTYDLEELWRSECSLEENNYDCLRDARVTTIKIHIQVPD